MMHQADGEPAQIHGAIKCAESCAVIVISWNSGPLLERCLEAISAQTIAPRKIIVFDNASTDDSARDAGQRFPGVEFLLHDVNAGFARANNLCVQHSADCDWVMLVNPDAFPEPDCVEKLLRAVEQNPAFDVFAPLILKSEASGRIDSAGDRDLPSGIGVHRLQGQPREAARQPCEVFSASAAGALYRRSAFLGVGGFDEALFTWYEDVDLGFRLRLAGQRTWFVPDAVVHHMGGGVTGGAGNDNSAWYCQRNFIRVYLKDMPGSLLWRYLPAHLWAILKGLLKGVRQGRGRLLAAATWAACRQLPDTLRARRQVQGLRKLSLAEVLESFSL